MLKKQISLKDPQTKILLITIAIVFATYITSQKFVLWPHREKLTKLKGQLEHINLEDEIARISNEVNTCEKYLPTQKDSSWLLTQLTELASQSKVNIESIEPLPPTQVPPYLYVSFRIRTTSTFSKIISFLESIEASPFILSIETLNLTAAGIYAPEVPMEKMGKETEARVEIVIGTIY